MSLKAPTHHISAQVGDFAKTVLFPGDPLRAKMIGETYLQDSECINQVRGLYAYTGYYNGQRVSVMGGGMGGSSTANITWTLFNLYDVDSIIRIGTAGAFQPWLSLFDIIIGQGSSHDTNYHAQYKLNGTLTTLGSFDLLEKTVAKAREMNLNFHVGDIFCSNQFYYEDPDHLKGFARMGCLGVDQETAVLYMTAAAAGKKALTIDTISDHVWGDKAKLSAEERQESCKPMIELALAVATS